MKPSYSKYGQIGVMCVVCFITFFVNNRIIVPDIMESWNIVTAREMVYDGHWLVPTMNGELRLEKPPLPTWLTAIAEMVSPDNLALQRGMAGLAAVLLVCYFWKFARRVLQADPLIPALLLCTCYNVVLMGRTASWDIYCHAFMMGGIYHLARALQAPPCAWRHFVAAGVLTGFSILSKGPVSPYALLLPFLISYSYCYRPSMKGKWGAFITMTVLALAIGLWWYACLRLFHADALIAVVEKESGSWFNRSVRPWWYYWKFFLEAGVWSLLLLTAIFLPFFDRARRTSRQWLFPLAWLLLSLVLLSLMPEKKSRYLLPILIPAGYVMGCMMAWWKSTGDLPGKTDQWAFRLNAVLVMAAIAALPVAAWLFLCRPGYLPWPIWSLFTAFCAGIPMYIGRSLRRGGFRPVRLLTGVVLLFLAAECFAFPFLGNIINNPDMKSIALTRQMKELDGLPFYHNGKDPLRIELVYAARRNIRPLATDCPDSILQKLPCAILTHRHAGEELPAALWDRADTLYIGQFDDNGRPKGKHYNNAFVYHVTVLKAKERTNQ